MFFELVIITNNSKNRVAIITEPRYYYTMTDIQLRLNQFIVYSGVTNLILYDLVIDGKTLFTYALTVNKAYKGKVDKRLIMDDFFEFFDLYYEGEHTHMNYYKDDGEIIGDFLSVEDRKVKTLFQQVLDEEYG